MKLDKIDEAHGLIVELLGLKEDLERLKYALKHEKEVVLQTEGIPSGYINLTTQFSKEIGNSFLKQAKELVAKRINEIESELLEL